MSHRLLWPAKLICLFLLVATVQTGSTISFNLVSAGKSCHPDKGYEMNKDQVKGVTKEIAGKVQAEVAS